MLFLEITISLTDLLQALLYLAGIAALVGLTILLINLAKSFKSINKLVDDINPSVTETVEQLPATMLKVQGILDDAKKITESAGENIPGLVKSASEAGQTLTNTVGILGTGAESLSASLVSLIAKPMAKNAKKDKAISLEIGKEESGSPTFAFTSGDSDKLSKLSQIAGAAIGTYRFVKKLQKAKKRKDRKSKFGF